MAVAASELAELAEMADRLDYLEAHNQISKFEPYPWQIKLYEKDDGEGNEAMQRLAMCANRVGKTYSEAAEVSYHATGRYPDWWEGFRFDKPILIWACGVSADTTRDIVQESLLGDCENWPESFGTGSIPGDCLDFSKKIIKRGATTGTLYSVNVKHVSGGWSKIAFKSYEQGEEKFMGKSVNYIWLDEEPPGNIYTQCITRTADCNGLVTMTYTPEKGMTSTTNQFLHDIKPGQKLVQATWDDVPHLNEQTKNQLLAQYSEGERKMRSQGIPVFGSGMVFPLSEDEIACEPFKIPEDWPRISAIDFGWEHPTAVVWLAVDEETDTVYVYDTYRKNKTLIPLHAAAIKRRSSIIPMAWPHDGMKSESGSGKGIAQQYREEGLNLLPTHFTNPPTVSDTAKSTKGDSPKNFRIEPGIAAMHKAMETGGFRVFNTQTEWFEEFRIYHRKDGKIVDVVDDLMSATRYAFQSRRFAQTVAHHEQRNQPLDYSEIDRGIT